MSHDRHSTFEGAGEMSSLAHERGGNYSPYSVVAHSMSLAFDSERSNRLDIQRVREHRSKHRVAHVPREIVLTAVQWSAFPREERLGRSWSGGACHDQQSQQWSRHRRRRMCSDARRHERLARRNQPSEPGRSRSREPLGPRVPRRPRAPETALSKSDDAGRRHSQPPRS
jgi:hypothetical protein